MAMIESCLNSMETLGVPKEFSLGGSEKAYQISAHLTRDLSDV